MTAITHASPFPHRLWAYLQERFPLFAHGILIVSYYSSNQFFAEVLHSPNQPVHYTRWSFVGALCLFCVFFHLRVFDEHKDYDDDCRHYPDRLLSQGVVTLKHLKVLGIFAIVVELITSLSRGLPTFISWAMVFIFSLLMLKEFFCKDWLNKHFLIYAISHMLIMPMLALLIYSFTSGDYFWNAPAMYYLYAWVGFFVSFNWEVSRKIRAPEQEREGITTYTKIFGTYGAGYLVLLIRVVDTLMVSLVGFYLGLTVWFYVLLWLLFLVCLYGFLDFRTHTNEKTAKRMETYAGMYIIAFDIILAIAIIYKVGFSL